MIRLILILLFFSMSFAQTIGTTSDGKTVIINEDGTWEIVEEDYSLLLENEKKYTETTIDYFKVWKESSFKKDFGNSKLLSEISLSPIFFLRLPSDFSLQDLSKSEATLSSNISLDSIPNFFIKSSSNFGITFL